MERLPLNAKHIVSCRRKVSGEINARHDIVVNIILNNILMQRGLARHEQDWDEKKIVKRAKDEITVGTEHWRSDDTRELGRVSGAKLKPDLMRLRRDTGDRRMKVVSKYTTPISNFQTGLLQTSRVITTRSKRLVATSRRVSGDGF